jgi:hypothetical protein
MSSNLNVVLLWFVAAVQGVVLWGLRRHFLAHRRPSTGSGHRKSGISTGSSAPHFSASELLTGIPVTSAEFSSQSVVMLFLSADCTVCAQFAGVLKEYFARPVSSRKRNLIVSCEGARRACLSRFSNVAEVTVVLVRGDDNLLAKFEIDHVPTLVKIDKHWRIERYEQYLGLSQPADWLLGILEGDSEADARRPPAHLSEVAAKTVTID